MRAPVHYYENPDAPAGRTHCAVIEVTPTMRSTALGDSREEVERKVEVYFRAVERRSGAKNENKAGTSTQTGLRSVVTDEEDLIG